MTAEPQTKSASAERSGATAYVAAIVHGVETADLPAPVVETAKQSILDWLGVTLAGAREPLVTMLLAEVDEEGGHPQASLIGLGGKRTVSQATLVNGSAGHALDYDDVHWLALGHPTVPLLPALFALAEHRRASGSELLAAYVAGFEAACRMGAATGRSHYAKGWHGTATIGSLSAAAACARLLRLSPEATARAIGIAATQAGGLKSMFGTMCKPFHAGRAAYNGLLAARLAARGFTSREDALEAEQGFGWTLSDDFDGSRVSMTAPGGFHVRQNLFKFHAACYLTHSSIEALRDLRARHGIEPQAVESVALLVDSEHLKVCNIERPRTGLEVKFSLRHTAALALAGEDTAALATYSDANAQRPDLAALAERVRVVPTQHESHFASRVSVRLKDGQELSAEANVGIAAPDLEAQGQRLTAKFLSLSEPVVGKDKASEIARLCAALDRQSSLEPLIGCLS